MMMLFNIVLCMLSTVLCPTMFSIAYLDLSNVFDNKVVQLRTPLEELSDFEEHYFFSRRHFENWCKL